MTRVVPLGAYMVAVLLERPYCALTVTWHASNFGFHRAWKMRLPRLCAGTYNGFLIA
jgi:hypothetical protein